MANPLGYDVFISLTTISVIFMDCRNGQGYANLLKLLKSYAEVAGAKLLTFYQGHITYSRALQDRDGWVGNVYLLLLYELIAQSRKVYRSKFQQTWSGDLSGSSNA